MIKLSLILPIFNTEKYLHDTFKSILDQDIDQNLYEIVVVNDGSTDSSPDIIQKFNDCFLNFKYCSQENKGVSAARNRGLALASGEYILFLDADDMLRKDAFSFMLKSIEQEAADLWFCSHSYSPQLALYAPDDFLSEVYFPVFVWKTCIRRAFIKENNLKFSEGYILEDGVFLLEAVLKAKKIVTLNHDLVKHRRSENSLMRDYSSPKKNRNMIASFVFVINRYRQFLDENRASLSPRACRNLTEREESFIFFMYFRMIRYKYTDREIEKKLSEIEFRSFAVFPGPHVNKISYKILAPFIEKRTSRKVINWLYRRLKSIRGN